MRSRGRPWSGSLTNSGLGVFGWKTDNLAKWTLEIVVETCCRSSSVSGLATVLGAEIATF